MKPQIFISAATAGSGKTLFAMGLSRLLKRRGYRVQPYKCGPDFFDSQLLSIASGNDTVNLDTWLSTHNHAQYLYNKYGERSDVCLTEGAGILFDGYRRMLGSSAEMAGLLNVPVILLVNARMVGYSVAPLIYGFKNFYSGIRIAGVVFSQITSQVHYMRLREACADVSVDCLGYIPSMDTFKLPSKRSVISLANRRSYNELSDEIASQLEETVDVNRLLGKCNRNFPCQYTLPYSSEADPELSILPIRKIKIAVARDPAFCFTYRENISRLKSLGEITYFSPLYGSELPEADLVYLPGGYPEQFARQLHRRYKMMEELKNYVENGGKIWAEGGGMVFLGRTLKSRENGTAYPMSNVLPVDFTVLSVPKLCSGYRKMICGEQEFKGYEFRYSSLLQDDTPSNYNAALITDLKGADIGLPLYRYKNVVASYVHWYFGDKDILKMWE